MSMKSKGNKKIYTISSEGELREVKWLISEGVYNSVEEYIINTTKLLYGYKPKPEEIRNITTF